jgi:hypothetical protein
LSQIEKIIQEGKLKNIIVLLLLLQIAGCNFYSEENQQLRNDLRQSEIEISSLMGSPQFMFGEAFDLADQKNYKDASAQLEHLKKSFPEWNADIVTEFIERFSQLADQG